MALRSVSNGANIADSTIEANLAQNAESFYAGSHTGYEPNALEGLKLSLPLVAEKNIKIIVNGGSLNPEGLARVVASLVRRQRLYAYAAPEQMLNSDSLGARKKLRSQGCLAER